MLTRVQPWCTHKLTFVSFQSKKCILQVSPVLQMQLVNHARCYIRSPEKASKLFAYKLQTTSMISVENRCLNLFYQIKSAKYLQLYFS